jgi:hypothetical protein
MGDLRHPSLEGDAVAGGIEPPATAAQGLWALRLRGRA